VSIHPFLIDPQAAARLAEADAVIFDACGAGNKAVAATAEQIEQWAEEGKARYLPA
jgi:tRNA A37 methylthiotransferase MiaB